MLCVDGCCSFTICPVKKYKTIPYKNTNPKKAGVVVYNSIQQKVLLIQSRGKLWGFPKGTMEHPETLNECAIRELKEETGISLNVKSLDVKNKTNINRSTYYYYDTMDEIGSVQEEDPFNDVNGLVWIKLSCLKKLYDISEIKLNYQCKYILINVFKLDIIK